MDKIAKELKIGAKLTTYVARHTFSTILKRGGVPIAYISESPGHTDLRTTENYLGSFEDEQKIEFAKLLIPAKKLHPFLSPVILFVFYILIRRIRHIQIFT